MAISLLSAIVRNMKNEMQYMHNQHEDGVIFSVCERRNEALSMAK
jgi:hypothetical protein